MKGNFSYKDRVFIVAEIGNNHEGNIEVAKELIKEASQQELIRSNSKHIFLKICDFLNNQRVSLLKKFQLSNNEFLELAGYQNSLI